MGVRIPDHFDLDVDLDLIGPVELSGIPSNYSLNITHLPKIQLAVDSLTINPLDVSVRLKEFPSIRGHIPADFTVGLSILGVQLFCLRLCGEAQVITEPYHPNPCERCEDVPTKPVREIRRTPKSKPAAVLR